MKHFLKRATIIFMSIVILFCFMVFMLTACNSENKTTEGVTGEIYTEHSFVQEEGKNILDYSVVDQAEKATILIGNTEKEVSLETASRVLNQIKLYKYNSCYSDEVSESDSQAYDLILYDSNDNRIGNIRMLLQNNKIYIYPSSNIDKYFSPAQGYFSTVSDELLSIMDELQRN